MPDDFAHEPEPSDEVTSAARFRRGPVLLFAVAVVVAVAAGFTLGRSGAPVQPASATDPSAALASALDAGMPAYVLIHSSS